MRVIADKIEAFPQTYPRAMQLIEPVLLHLMNFSSKNFSPLFVVLLFITTVAQLVLFLAVFPPSPILDFIFPFYLTCYTTAITLLSVSVKRELGDRFLNDCNDFTPLRAAFFGIDADSLVKLNEWSAVQREENPNYPAVRKKLVSFFEHPDNTWLCLVHYRLSSLPDIFNAPAFRKLKKLDLSNNRLTELPPSITHLQSLKNLKLDDNRALGHLPEVVLSLPSSCTVYINNCNISSMEIANLSNIVNAPTYSGPRINYSLNERPESSIRILERLANLAITSDEVPSVERLLRNLYQRSGIPYKELPNLREIPYLDQWLHKLFFTADFQGDLWQSAASRVITYLERANDDTSYRQMLRVTISDAVNSCGDRVALSILKLGITYQLSTVNAKDIQRIHYVLTRGTWALELLQEVARQKVSSMRLVDEVEVYLGYPIRLKQELNLPIEVTDMLYYAFSALTPEDLETAKNFVLSTINNKKEQIDFLLTQPEWMETLESNYKKDYIAIKEKRDKASNIPGCNWEAVGSVYDQEIRNLTERALESFHL